MKTKYFLYTVVGLVMGYAITACNSSAEEEKVNEDSLNKSTLDNRDVDNRNVLIYDSTKQQPSDTVKAPQ